MRYFTKEWMELLQETHDTFLLKKIPNKEYTKKDIDELYKKELKKAIAAAKRYYNEEQEEVENRPPFDSAERIAEFEEIYQYRLKSYKDYFPAWVCDKVDKRLLALHLMPESVYVQYKQEQKEKEKALQRVYRGAEKEDRKQLKLIPPWIYEIFDYADGNILSIEKKAKDVIMVLRKEGAYRRQNIPYDRIIFRDVKLFEREKGLRICSRKDEKQGYVSNCYYLNDELYKIADGYEYHLMVTAGKLRYVTIQCRTILHEENIKFEK